jgi:hypothetical protein
MPKLTDIKNCHVCSSPRLTPRYGIYVPDIFTDEEIKRNVLQCDDCDTLHYIDNGTISYEFSCKVNQSIFSKQHKVNE